LKQREPGLEHRVQRQTRRIFSQHRQLDEMYELLLRKVDRGIAEPVREVFRSFEQALDAHFHLEEEHTFPAVRGLHPKLDAALASLVREHGAFRRDLETLRSLLDRGELGAFGDPLDALALRLAEHEGREEQLLEKAEPEP